MTVISTKEFVSNEDKYFDMAMTEEIFVQRDNAMFIVQNITQNIEPDVVFEPDENFYRSIPMEEVRDKIVGYMRKKNTK